MTCKLNNISWLDVDVTFFHKRVSEGRHINIRIEKNFQNLFFFISASGRDIHEARKCCRVMIDWFKNLKIRTEVHVYLVNMCPTITQWLRNECVKSILIKDVMIDHVIEQQNAFDN